jgi:hypothetical protein
MINKNTKKKFFFHLSTIIRLFATIWKVSSMVGNGLCIYFILCCYILFINLRNSCDTKQNLNLWLPCYTNMVYLQADAFVHFMLHYTYCIMGIVCRLACLLHARSSYIILKQKPGFMKGLSTLLIKSRMRLSFVLKNVLSTFMNSEFLNWNTIQYSVIGKSS